MVWTEWSLDRVIILFVGLAYLFMGIQVTMSHYKQNFHHKAMWVPVILSPIICLSSIVLTFVNNRGFYNFVHIIFWLGAVAGLIGFVFHFRGVGLRVGGYASRNFLIGPPVILPLMFTALSVLGLIAIYGR
jgi:lysylphosphatidylglycerol synthetase-like protein (DUF2156 family)